MKKFLLSFFSLILILNLISYAQGQEKWYYTKRLYFPPADSNKVRPYLATLASNGTPFG